MNVSNKPLLESKAIDMVRLIQEGCVRCRECCRAERFPLADTEVFHLARTLFDMGGESVLRTTIYRNTQPLNVLEKFYLSFEEDCPYLIDDKCMFGDNRPLTCQLFPLSLIAFIDNPRMKLRDAHFTVTGPKSEYGCYGIGESLLKILDEIANHPPPAVSTSLRLAAALLLNRSLLAYCFGQHFERGARKFNPKPSGIFISEIEIGELLAREHIIRYGIPDNPNSMPHLVELDKESINKLISDSFRRKSVVKTNKRLRHLEDYDKSLLKWHSSFGLRAR